VISHQVGVKRVEGYVEFWQPETGKALRGWRGESNMNSLLHAKDDHKSRSLKFAEGRAGKPTVQAPCRPMRIQASIPPQEAESMTKVLVGMAEAAAQPPVGASMTTHGLVQTCKVGQSEEKFRGCAGMPTRYNDESTFYERAGFTVDVADKGTRKQSQGSAASAPSSCPGSTKGASSEKSSRAGKSDKSGGSRTSTRSGQSSKSSGSGKSQGAGASSARSSKAGKSDKSGASSKSTRSGQSSKSSGSGKSQGAGGSSAGGDSGGRKFVPPPR